MRKMMRFTMILIKISIKHIPKFELLDMFFLFLCKYLQNYIQI